METKSLLYGLIGFFLGGLLVSVAATTFDKPYSNESKTNNTSYTHGMSMDDMSASLYGKTGDDYDKAFIAGMIAHHEGAIAMAKQSASSAKHSEIKQLSEEIIAAQAKEIETMKQWQKDWGYSTTGSTNSPTMPHDMHDRGH